jgi:protein NrfD
MPEQPTPHRPHDRALRPRGSVHDTDLHDRGVWGGPTYYGRPQLKAAPFNTWVVGGYVALAGMCGAASIISAVADLAEGRPAARLVRGGRYLALLAPTLGSVLLIWDLHTPKRFYNMFRVAKGTSPMSIGTWVLTGYSLSAIATATLQFVSDRLPRFTWARKLARLTQLPSALSGSALGTYTAALLSTTSNPLWAAAPRQMAVRFGSSSMVAGAAALSLLEGSGRRRRKLDTLALASLSAELAATIASHRTYERRGVAATFDSKPGRLEHIGATTLGAAVPAALQVVSLALGRRRGDRVSDVASLLTIAGSLLLRVSMMQAGNVSAGRPDISFRFSQPENLPRV